MTSPKWLDPFEPTSMRKAVSKVLIGTNFRIFFESQTRTSLLDTYAQLKDLAFRHAGNNNAWEEELRSKLADGTTGPMREWLIGLTKKTAQNLEIRTSNYGKAFDEMMAEIGNHPSGLSEREAALLLWCGAATLSIRGSSKSRAGKALERSCAAAALSALGLQENEHFWLDIAADDEIDRQMDAEVATTRGRVRIEVGFIGVGNPEVIGDKVGRLDRNGVVMFDKLPAKSAMWETAQRQGVKLIQIRNNHPVEELRCHLLPLGAAVQAEPISLEQVEERILAMPPSRFAI